MKILILNGPNLNLLGIREKSIYGEDNFDAFFNKISQKYGDVELSYFQSNIEGEIIDKLHATGFDYDGIILNAGGYTHTSVAIADAIAAINTPVIEVHISNIYAREDFRHKSLLSKNCIGIISGLGLEGYETALLHLINKN